MKYFIERPRVNVKELREQLDAHPELWNEIDWRKRGAHEEVDDIWVRYNDYRKYPNPTMLEFRDRHVPVWYPAWRKLPALRPIIFGLMAQEEGEMLGGVLITRVKPGCQVYPHKDDGWHVNYFDKFYVCLGGAHGARLFCKDEYMEPLPGDVHWFDNRREHWVTNESTEDRITLIVCIRTERYRNAHEQFARFG